MGLEKVRERAPAAFRAERALEVRTFGTERLIAVHPGTGVLAGQRVRAAAPATRPDEFRNVDHHADTVNRRPSSGHSISSP